MPEVCDGIRARLFLLTDPAYRAFQQPLIPTVPPERVIGVRTPALRALARGSWQERRRRRHSAPTCRTGILRRISCTPS